MDSDLDDSIRKFFSGPYREVQTLAELVKTRRNQIEKTQQQLADDSGISSGYVARIEGGYSVPKNKKILRALANALGIDAQYILLMADIENTSPSRLSKQYPRIFSLISKVFAIMTEQEKQRTVYQLEWQLRLSQENEIELARKFIRYLTGDLKLEEDPGNGSRPLINYLQSNPNTYTIQIIKTSNIHDEEKKHAEIELQNMTHDTCQEKI